MFNNKCSECGKKELSKADINLIINPNVEMCQTCYEKFIVQEQGANE